MTPTSVPSPSAAAPAAETPLPAPHATAFDPTEKPRVTIRAGQRNFIFEFKEMLRFRDLLMALAMRDIRLRYKQTILGGIWVVIQPLMAAGIFTLVFGIIAGMDSGDDHIPYFVKTYAALLGWNLFSNTLSRISSCLLGNGHLISKVYFPRLILPLSSFPGILLDFGIAAILMAVMMLLFHVNPGLPLLLAPLWLLLFAALAFGIGLLAGSLAVSYRDVNYILPVATQILLYASPIAFTLAKATGSHPKLAPFFTFNPLTAPLEGLRWSLLGSAPPPLLPLATSLAATLLFNLAGILVFKSMERKFADVI